MRSFPLVLWVEAMEMKGTEGRIPWIMGWLEVGAFCTVCILGIHY